VLPDNGIDGGILLFEMSRLYIMMMATLILIVAQLFTGVESEEFAREVYLDG
jgi:hypothetical protein